MGKYPNTLTIRLLAIALKFPAITVAYCWRGSLREKKHWNCSQYCKLSLFQAILKIDLLKWGSIFKWSHLEVIYSTIFSHRDSAGRAFLVCLSPHNKMFLYVMFALLSVTIPATHFMAYFLSLFSLPKIAPPLFTPSSIDGQMWQKHFNPENDASGELFFDE